MDKTFWNIMQIGGLITSCLAGARLYEIGEDSFFYGFVLGIGALMFAAKYMGEEQEREMKKFNWNEFQNKDNRIAVHCKTEEEAKDFCERMHEQGMKWCSGESYLKETNYEFCEEEICYIKGEFSPYQYYKSNGYEILEWSDYMNKEFTKADLRDGMVVEQRDGDMYLVLAGMVVGKGEHNSIVGYTDGLKWAGYKGGDVVKVYRITPGSLGCIEDVFIKNNLELIWERKEPKKMTVKEMKQKLEELTGEEIEIEIV